MLPVYVGSVKDLIAKNRKGHSTHGRIEYSLMVYVI